MAFEIFKESGRSFKPKGSIRMQGQIGLSQGAVVRYKISPGQMAQLAYDRDNMIVGIKLVDEVVDGCKKIVIRDKNGSISAKSFLDYFGIDYSETRSFPLEEQEGMLVFKIKGDKDTNNIDT